MTNRTLRRLQALGLALACGVGASEAAETCTMSLAEMPVRMIGPRAIVDVGINGAKVPLMVDSGAFFSFLTPAAAQQLKLKLYALPQGLRIEGLNGEVDAWSTVVDQLVIEGGVIPNVEFVVGGTEMGAGSMGVLGRNFLAATDIEYDLAHGMIRFAFPKGDCGDTGFAYWAGEKPVVVLPLLRDEQKSKRPPVNAIAQVNDYKVRVLFDSGAPDSLLSRAAALRAGIEPAQMTPAGRSYGAGTGTRQAWTAPLGRFTLGDEQVSNIRMRVVDYDMRGTDMLLGMDFFLAHRIYISKSQRRMYFTHNGGPVFALSARDASMPHAAADAASTPADNSDDPTDAAAYARRGAARASRQDYEGALADLDRACSMAPDLVDCFVRRAAVHRAMRHPDLALRDYDAALKLDPNQPEALINRAGLQATKAREAALADLQTLDRTLPPQSALRMSMAQLYGRMELLREAIGQWSQWIPAHQDDALLPVALNARCWSRARLGIELDAALEDCDQALRADRDNPSYRDSRAWVHLRRGEPRRAMADFDAVIKLHPDNVWALYGRGLAHQGLGEADAARADLDAARKLRPKIDAEAGKFGMAAPG
ncbi:aspartyl protease family protein [Pelomonas sp. KK5]|uniref:aspartyl protease family protein n=1 Tax=Pelomonas sp. KK5 TaxID=1855730 RepID=UPI001301E990|nr:aspartyl protease family protein [Pelomonas sp. KK5]